MHCLKAVTTVFHRVENHLKIRHRLRTGIPHKFCRQINYFRREKYRTSTKHVSLYF